METALLIELAATGESSGAVCETLRRLCTYLARGAAHHLYTIRALGNHHHHPTNHNVTTMAAAPSSYKDRQFLAVIGDEVPLLPDPLRHPYLLLVDANGEMDG